MEFTPELLEKARKAESAEALQALAKKNDYEMSEDEAEAYFAQMHKSGELSDEELENVSGGGCRKNGHLVVTTDYSCEGWLCKAHGQRAVPLGIRNHDQCLGKEFCRYCYYCHYEKALWLCYNPRK